MCCVQGSMPRTLCRLTPIGRLSSPAKFPYEGFPIMDKKTFSLRRLKMFALHKFRALPRLLASLTPKRAGYCLNVLILLGVVAFTGASVVADPLPSALRISTSLSSVVEALPTGATKDNALTSEDEDVWMSGIGGGLPSSAETALVFSDEGVPASGIALASGAGLPSGAGDALPPTAGGVPATDDQQTLEALSVAVECCDSTYHREEWNKSWTNQVNSYLGWRQAECRYAFYDNNGSCASSNHRDHLVAVAEAHRSGGHAWERSRKEAFYLDTDNLYVLSGSVNTLKSDKDPAEWAPAVGTCRYAREWIAVKTEWGLSIDTAEKQALARMLNTCPAPPSP